jgi:hypothetical protein
MIKKMCCCDNEFNDDCIMDQPDFNPCDCNLIGRHKLTNKENCPWWKDVCVCEACGNAMSVDVNEKVEGQIA